MSVLPLAPPPQRFERARSQEQTKENHRQVIDNVFRVDHTSRKAIEMAHDRELIKELSYGRVTERGPTCYPQQQGSGKANCPGYDLILRQRRNKSAECQKAGTQQEQAEKPCHYGFPIGITVQ